MEQKHKYRIETILFAFIMLILGGIFLYRCQFGVNLTDELSYLASIKRMMQGDRFFIDDWSPTTLLCTWIEYQILRWLPVSFGEGCVLTARYIYIFLQAGITVILFIWLKGQKGRILMTCLYFVSTPYNIPALSYNTMAIGFMLLLCVFLVTRRQWHKTDYIFIGILYSLMVLSNPYLAILYFIHFLLGILLFIQAKITKRNVPDFLRLKSFCYITLGTAVCAVIFMLTILLQGDWAQSVSSLRYVLNDSEHSDMGFIAKFFESIWLIIRVWWRCTIPIGIIGIYTIVTSKKNNIKRDRILLGMTALVCLYATFRFAYIYGSISINLMLVPMAVMGIECLLLYHGPQRFLYGFWLFAGYLFAVCNYISSNTGVLSMSAMFIVPVVASAGLLMLVIGQLWTADGKWNPVPLALAAVPCICLIFMAHQRVVCTWYDADYTLLTERIERGPCRGMVTSEERKAEYDSALLLVDELEINQEDKVLFLPVKPLYYLYSKGRVGSPYTIRIQWNSEELIPYYEVNPQQMPELVAAVRHSQNGTENETDPQRMIEYFTEAGYVQDSNTEDRIVLRKENR